jgi:hypothetical protein
MFDNEIAVAAIQETKLNPTQPSPKFPGYTILRKDRTNHGGGIALLIHSSINFMEIPAPTPAAGPDPFIECQSIKIDLKDGPIFITNIYIPPNSSTPNYNASISHLFHNGNSDSLVLGDFNAHDQLWHSSISDNRGAILADEIDSSDFITLNTNSPTRLPINGAPSSPDISLASGSLASISDWKTALTLPSDHLPIIISISSANFGLFTPRTTFTNFNKANWSAFTAISEKLFEKSSLAANLSCSKAEQLFRDIISKAASSTIPNGRRKTFTPHLSKIVKELIKKRDDRRANNPLNDEIQNLNNEISQAIHKENRAIWRDTIENLDVKKSSAPLWRIIKSLNGKANPPPNNVIKFQDKNFIDPKIMATQFNKMFGRVRTHKSDNKMRKTIRKVKAGSLETPPIFTPDDVKNAIRKAKTSKATGPDNLSILHLKNLGDRGISFLTNMFNSSLASCNIPAIWKKSIIIPLLKAGKNEADATSYRPISLLCPAAKILESLILPFINTSLPPAKHQHGFRKNHSTTSALLKLSNHIANGFNQKQPAHRTIIIALDLSKAFDSVDHRLLIDLINDKCPSPIARWLSAYLRGRQSSTKFRNASSPFRIIRTGVPQGSVISPALFNAYIRDLPIPPPGIHLVSYADDITIYSSGPKIGPIVRRLNDYIPQLKEFLDNRSLTISATKSSVTLVTPDTKEACMHPKVFIDNILLPLEKRPKILGVTFDTMFTFSHHGRNIASKVSRRNNILKALAGSKWGQQKEIIATTYKAIGRSLINYAAPVWTPLISNSIFNKLQTAQNTALRIATGCTKMSPIPHLHCETEILPVKEHNTMLADQFYASCLDSNHPNHDLTTFERPRPMKNTLRSFSKDRVNRASTHFPQGPIRRIHQQIHTSTVQNTINNFPINSLLGTRPPRISKSEKKLPRISRTTLSQLRSGYCSALNSYRNRLDPLIPNNCPNCNRTPHDPHHLFICPSFPTTLKPVDLWTNPRLISEQLIPKLIRN